MARHKGYKIATLGTHSALQILHGAKQEGFETIAICRKGKEVPYKSYGVADKIILIDDYKDFPKLCAKLRKEKAIIIPHGSYVAYLGHQKVKELDVLYYGNKDILEWESDRTAERKWLKQAGLYLPKIYSKPSHIDRPVIVKFHGARGGKGYFLARDEADFRKKIKPWKNNNDYVIQEYMIGVPMYIHYFYSPLTEELEIMGMDKRYESNVDSLGRISARDQMALDKVDPSYTIVGNLPIVIRESFLPTLFKMGQRVIDESKKIAPPGLFGPFCLECVLTPEEEIKVFEISARIVAGTNPFIEGSPYTALRYNEPMSTGRRIARDIKIAIKQNKLDKLLT